MDIENYLNEMRRKLEENRQKISSGLFSSGLSDIRQPKEDVHLTLIDGMEPESQAKLGTFERMLNGEQMFQVKGTYDYNTSDYSPLVNLLSGIIEVESSLSLWQLFRRRQGIKMPYYYDKKSHTNREVKRGKQTINIDESRATLGTLLICCELYEHQLSNQIGGFGEIVHIIKTARNIRNDASHGMVIDKQRFNTFFNEYVQFHENRLSDLINLKLKMQMEQKDMEDSIYFNAPEEVACENKEYKEALPADEYIARLNTMFDELIGSAATMSDDFKPAELTEKIGIILTDTKCLASKYACTREEVLNVITTFINESEKFNQYWLLLDMSGQNTGGSWVNYNYAVSQFIDSKNLRSGLNLHLLIVGGQDVVPCGVLIVKSLIKPKETTDIPTDLCYAFHGNFFDCLESIMQFGIDIDDIRNSVSRLPLQNGSLSHHNVEKDLGGYFSKSLAQMRGIKGKNIVMVTNKQWLTNSDNITNNIPLSNHADDPEISYKNMYVSPLLDADNASTMNNFKQSNSEADLLLFNLHGSPYEGYPSFYGEGDDRKCYKAFSLKEMAESSSKVFYTISCYGARYATYSRDDSMLMTAIYKSNALVYVGSQVSVPMISGPNDISRRAVMFGQYNGSEVLLRMLTLYSYYGESMGCTFMRAICDYFNKFRLIEDEDFALRTIMMFSLYGNPMLSLQKNEKMLLSAIEYKGTKEKIECDKAPIIRTETKLVYDKSVGYHKSLLDKLRGMVDDNFESIHKIVEENLYRELGLPARQLETVNSFSRTNAKGEISSGYIYTYYNPDVMFSKDTAVEVDKMGKILRIYTTK